MARFKFISGNIDPNTTLNHFFGVYVLQHPKGFISTEDYKLYDNLVSITQITDENKASFVGKAGWGLVGGLALGPVGLLAGLLAGGNKKVACCAFEMLPNYRFVAEIEAKTYAALTDVAQRNRAAGKALEPIPDADPQTQPVSPVQDVPTRLANLDNLRAQNLITDEEYAAQRQRILNDL